MGQNGAGYQSLCSSFHWRRQNWVKGKVDRFQHLNISVFPQELIHFAWRLEGAYEPLLRFIHLSHVKSWWKGEPKSLKCVDNYSTIQDILLSKNHRYSPIDSSHTSPPFHRLGHLNWKCLTDLLRLTKKCQLSWELLWVFVWGLCLANGFPMRRLYFLWIINKALK